ncbi:MAG: hypothetical protein RR929_01190 [Erysipelotrichaceae bacterium]
MNRQALAFLTMFSLVLILSVYYITLPNDTAVVQIEEGNKDQEGNKKEEEKKETKKTEGTEGTEKKEETENKETNNNQEKINAAKDDEINSNKETIANSKKTEEEKKEAINKVEKLEKDKKLVEELVEKCKAKGWETSIEIKEMLLKVNIHKIKKDTKIANEVIMYLSKETKNAYNIEVKFI